MLARRMPVYAYELDMGDVPGTAALPSPPVPDGSRHGGGWYLPTGYDTTPTTLDPNQQALQNDEIARVTMFSRNGMPTGTGTIPWPTFNRSKSILAWTPGGDTQVITERNLSNIHHCTFWNRVAPVAGKPAK